MKSSPMKSSSEKSPSERSPSERTKYHHGNLRVALLDAADELLEQQGLQGFTLRGCARLADVSHAAPKHHFGDVSGLLTAVAERGFSRLVEQLSSALTQAQGDLHAEMVATCRSYVDFARQNPEHFRIMFRSDLLKAKPDHKPESMRETYRVLTNVILRQRGEPELQPDDLPLVDGKDLANDVIMGWCHIHGFAHLLLEGQLTMIDQDNLEFHLVSNAHRLSDLLATIQHSRRDA